MSRESEELQLQLYFITMYVKTGNVFSPHYANAGMALISPKFLKRFSTKANGKNIIITWINAHESQLNI